MAKIFIPASSTNDSVALLYKTLSETNDHVITRMLHSDATTHDIMQYHPVCEWLRDNVRDFDFDFAENETLPPEILEDKDGDKPKGHLGAAHRYHQAWHATHHKADVMYIGFNLWNWGKAHWYYQSAMTVDEFYDNEGVAPDGKKYTGWTWHRKGTSLHTDWPLIARGSKPLGREQCYEMIPDELKKIISVTCNYCGKCAKCGFRNWYLDQKKLGKTAEWCDDEAMRLGEYGKYWSGKTTWQTGKSLKHKAYENYIK